MIDMEGLLNVVRREAYRAVARVAQPRIGLVSGYNPDTHAVKVRFQPEDAESGWIPLQSQATGNGWGMVSGPKIGDQVKVSFQEGDGEAGMVIGRVFSDKDRPPRVEAGETILRHEQGATIKLDKDGHITIAQDSGASARIRKDGQVSVKPAGGRFVYLGGDPDDDPTAVYGFVQTSAGLSTTAKAKV